MLLRRVYIGTRTASARNLDPNPRSATSWASYLSHLTSAPLSGKWHVGVIVVPTSGVIMGLSQHRTGFRQCLTPREGSRLSDMK